MNITKLKEWKHEPRVLTLTDPKLDYAIQSAMTYINNVTIKQERLLPKEELYAGYKATVNHLTIDGFEMLYDAYKDTLKEKGII